MALGLFVLPAHFLLDQPHYLFHDVAGFFRDAHTSHVVQWSIAHVDDGAFAVDAPTPEALPPRVSATTAIECLGVVSIFA